MKDGQNARTGDRHGEKDLDALAADNWRPLKAGRGRSHEQAVPRNRGNTQVGLHLPDLPLFSHVISSVSVETHRALERFPSTSRA